jgi:hypothetical protein
MGYDWEELAAWTDFAALADIWYPTYAEELPGISPEQMSSLCELEARCATGGDEVASAALNDLLDEICETILPEDNAVLAVVEQAIRQVESTGVWANLDDIVDTMKRARRAIREEAIKLITLPQSLREHLEQEVRFTQAIEHAEAALDAADDMSDFPFMGCFPADRKV